MDWSKPKGGLAKKIPLIQLGIDRAYQLLLSIELE